MAYKQTMAASKEAIVIVLDVGPAMCQDNPKSLSVLQKSKTCINMVLQRKIFSESKDEVALVLFGTAETANKLAGGSEYTNIKVAQGLKPANWELLRYVQDIEGTDITADFVDALVVAMDILQAEASKFASHRILFFSNFCSPFCSDQIDVICEGLRVTKTELNVISPVVLMEDDDSHSNDGVKSEKHKNPEQIKAENMIKKILKMVEGESYTFSEALPALIYYQKKKVQSSPWNASLEIGTNLTIPISGYIKVSENKVKPWRNAHCQQLEAKIIRETTYHLNDEAQTEIPKDSVVPAYRYGTTLVPFSEEDKMNMEYQSGEKGMKVLGFTKEENIHRHHYVGDKTMYIFGQKGKEFASKQLAPFIQALFETKMVAVVRYVYSPRSAPKIGFLFPRVKLSYECLVFIILPFMEDLRHYIFAPLDADPKNLPTDEQQAAVDDLISAMDLSVAAVDEEGNRGEALKSRNTVNPMLQRLYQCLQHRVFHPGSALPDLPTHMKAVIEPAPELTKASESVIKRMKRIFPLKEVQQKSMKPGLDLITNGKSEGVTEAKRTKTVSDTEVVLPVGDKILEVGTIQPVRDFEHLVKEGTKPFGDVCKQLERAVLRLLGDVMVNALHDKIIGCVKSYREAVLKKDDPVQFNVFLKGLKETLISKNQDLWTKFINEKLGLITASECSSSNVSSEDSTQFFTSQPPPSENKTDEPDDVDEDELLGQM